MNVNDLTIDIVKSYADACRQLHDYIAVLRTEGYDLLVVPSRGAHPFLDGANSYAHKLRADRYTDFTAPPLWPIEELYLPFTADIGTDVPVLPSEVRGYWARTLAAIIRRDHKDVAYRFYEFLRGMAGELAIGSTQIRGGQSGKFIFVDTVQSGQAIAEIFTAFNRYGLTNCHFLLLLDQRGDRLKPDHARLIDQMVAERRATVIHVDKIFTEDEGPSMSGIWTVTFPDLMIAAKKMLPELADAQETAAGLYYHEVSKRPDGSNVDFTVSNAILATLLFSAVRNNDRTTASFLDEFKTHIDRNKLQRQEITRQIAHPLVARNLPIDTTDVSGSHVIRAYMKPDLAEALLKAFLKP